MMMRSRRPFYQWVSVVFLAVCFPFASSQQKVNILLFYEWYEAVRGFDAAIEYINGNPSLGFSVGEVYKVFPNGTDATTLITSFCEEIDAAYGNGPDARPDIVVDLTRHGVPSEVVKILTKIMTLPTVSGSFGQEGDIQNWKDLTEEQKGYLIHIAPPADMLPQVVRSIVSKQNMMSAALLFNEEYEMSHKYKSLLQNLPTKQLLSKLEEDASGIRRQTDHLIHQDFVNFFIAASPNEISGVLVEASDPEMRDGPYFGDEYAWYSMSMEPGLPRCTGCRNNVAIIHLLPQLPEGGKKRKDFLTSNDTSRMERLMDMFYFDLTMNAVETVAKMKKNGDWVAPPTRICKDQDTFPNDYKLPLFDNIKSGDISKENLLGPFHFDPGNTAGKSHAQFKMTIRRLVFKYGQADPEINVDLGTWEAGFGEKELITSEGKEEHWKQHRALTVFRVVTVVQPPFVYKGPCEAAANFYSRCFTGYLIDLLDKIQEELQFNYTIRHVSSYGYMGDEPPHEWDGMVGELQRRRADIALGAMSVMPERESAVDFTVPIYDMVGISILMRKPRVQTSRFKFLTVLENDVWFCIVVAYFLTSILMWVFDRWSPYSYQNKREEYEDDEDKRVFNLRECLWFCITSITPQGGGEMPKPLSGKVVAQTWWLFCFIIVASYTANLAAFLTVSRLDDPIESLDDLTKQNKIMYAPQQWSTAWIYFDRMAYIEHRFYELWRDMSLNDSLTVYERSQLAVWDYPVSHKYTEIWQAMQENAPPMTYEDAIARVRGKARMNDGFAFLDEATNNRYQTLISCDLKEVGEEFSRKPYAIAVQKGSPLKEILSRVILKLYNQRYLEQLKEKWWNENPNRAICPNVNIEVDGISIHNIGGVFCIILVGIGLTCITLVFEYLWHCWRKAPSHRVTATLSPPQDLDEMLSTEKTNFNTKFTKKTGTDLTQVENDW